MRVPVDTDAMMRLVNRHWEQQQQIVASSSARIATGTRLVSAVDDVAGVAIAERVRSQFEALHQAGRNAQEGINFVEIAQGSLTQTTTLVQRLRVLALQSANGTFDDSQRGLLQRTVVLTLDELDALVRRSQANGIGLLDGSRPSLSVQTGTGAGDVFDVALRAADRDALGLGPLSVATQEDSVSALDRLDEAIEILNAHRAEMAAAQNRLAHMVRTLGASGEAAEAAHARISDADIGVETARLLRAQISSQAGAAMMVQVRQAMETVLHLLLPPAGAPDAAASGSPPSAPASSPVPDAAASGSPLSAPASPPSSPKAEVSAES